MCSGTTTLQLTILRQLQSSSIVGKQYCVPLNFHPNWCAIFSRGRLLGIINGCPYPEGDCIPADIILDLPSRNKETLTAWAVLAHSAKVLFQDSYQEQSISSSSPLIKSQGDSNVNSSKRKSSI